MKEVNIIPDDAKSAECIKQLEQVNCSFQHISFLSINISMHKPFLADLELITLSDISDMTNAQNFYY